MLKLSLLIVGVSLSILVIETNQELFVTAGCKTLNSTCTSATECCSGACSGKCVAARCRPLSSSCSPLTNNCCRGLQCDKGKKTCCRGAGQPARTPSECCSNAWKANTNGRAGGICCSQHAGPCSTASDCCSSLEHCSNPQWPNMCV